MQSENQRGEKERRSNRRYAKKQTREKDFSKENAGTAFKCMTAFLEKKNILSN